MSIFNVGDRVLCTKSFDRNNDIVYKKGTIIGFIGKIPCVEYDEYVGGHDGLDAKILISGRTKGKLGFCWNTSTKCLKKIYNDLIPYDDSIEAQL